MKKSNFKNLKLRKESISKLDQSKVIGAFAETCEPPCQGGTECCSGPCRTPPACYTENGAASCISICAFTGGIGYTYTWSSPAQE
jgi:hypothetical protein